MSAAERGLGAAESLDPSLCEDDPLPKPQKAQGEARQRAKAKLRRRREEQLTVADHRRQAREDPAITLFMSSNYDRGGFHAEGRTPPSAAEYECAHGNLSTDPHPDCDCYA